ncbi:hypothetical protein O6H91_02G009500 [Diphasiastrum complanatum]|uniref:Uncharacterized protein n=1 Tax=Diphasiastrum complanatum TaxID=34168 RepID=A0ACC2ECK9_DIPCM|nr:hypothetical protein O6H91_02G009500 [Diphasiastrum complanatum]
MIATLASEDPLQHPFWIAKVLPISRHATSHKITKVNVHWLKTDHVDAFMGKYSLEMISNGRGKSKKRKMKNIQSTSVLYLKDVDILVYDFKLTTTSHLRKSTIAILK